MKKIILLAPAILLAGCGGVRFVEQRPPLFVAETTKSAKAYADCVQEQWSYNGGAQLITRHDGSYRLVHYIGDIVDVSSTATGAHVEMRVAAGSLMVVDKGPRACL